VQKVGVVGTGALSAGIAELLTGAGLEVVLTPPTELVGLADADLVIESLPEDEAGKARALTEIAGHVGPDCVIATNTGSLSITGLAKHVSRPERFTGMHFFFDAPRVLPVVEIVRTRLVADATIETLRALAERIACHPLLVGDQPGLLVNHVLLPYLNQAVQDFEDGLATAADIEVAVKLGLGYPIGPLQLLDRMGLDVHLQATENIYAATREGRFAAPPLVRELVDAGTGLVAGSRQ
jgi:3-hydroxybutyryl-CoA dehydrogenase